MLRSAFHKFLHVKNSLCKRCLYPLTSYQCRYDAQTLSTIDARTAVIYIPDKIGDAMSVFPIIRSLDNYGIRQLVIVASTSNYMVFDGVVTRNAKLEVEIMEPHASASCFRVLKMAQNIRKRIGNPDLCFDAIRFDRYKTLIFFAALKSRINYKVGNIAEHRCFSADGKQASQLHAANAPILQVWKTLMETSGFPAPEARFEFPIDTRIENSVSLFVKPFDRYIALNLDGSLERKSISIEKARDIVALLYRNFQLPIVMVSSPSGIDKARMLTNEFPYIHMAPVSPSLDCSAAIVKNAYLLITPDTSILHMAGAFDTPVVAVYASNHNNSMWPASSSIAESVYVEGCASSVGLDDVDAAIHRVKEKLITEL